MEESSSEFGSDIDRERFIIKFLAGTGFSVVLEFGSLDELEKTRKKVEDAGLQFERLPSFNVKFDQTDLFMDMRSPVCAAQFDLEDWL